MRRNSISESTSSRLEVGPQHASLAQIGVGVATMGVVVASTTIAGALVGVAAVGCALGIVLFSSVVLAALMI